MRLNQYIAACGICSRREADRKIQEGLVLVNGEVAKIGMQVEDSDEIRVDNRIVKKQEKRVVLAYYKPVGVVCTQKDAHASKTVASEVKYPIRVSYAGRLDKDSEGLLLLSNDGNLINAMMKSANKHEKEYEVVVDKEISGDFLNRMSNGVYLKELDQTTRGCKLKRTGKRSFNIILTQGLNRQIRRMCQTLGFKVVSLKRIRVMTVKLSDYSIKPGEYVELDDKAMNMLYKEAGVKI